MNLQTRKLILRKINQEKPDIIGFQEVLPHVAKWLKENLNEYYVIGCGRGANLRDEQMSIAYRRDRINLISMKPGGCLRHQMCRDRDMKNRVVVLAQQQRRV